MSVGEILIKFESFIIIISSNSSSSSILTSLLPARIIVGNIGKYNFMY